MYNVFLVGGCCSGKSCAGRYMEKLGAWRVDLDEISRGILQTGSAVLEEVAQEFGEDIINPLTGELNRGLLAQRAFSSDEAVARLEAIEMPAIKEELAYILNNECCAARHPDVCVVEIPLLDRVEDMLGLADEVVYVYTPLDIRYRRADLRGLSQQDFEYRISHQPTDEYLRSHADTIFDNAGDEQSLRAQVDLWWKSHKDNLWR